MKGIYNNAGVIKKFHFNLKAQQLKVSKTEHLQSDL
jgi:hypothetical protein